MALFASRSREHLVRASQRDLRLLLPVDPGWERLLKYVRLFKQDVRPATEPRT